MKINITKREYRTLLDMVYVSDWVMHAHLTEWGENDYQALRRKLLSYYKEMDAEDIIEAGEETEEYYELFEYEEKMHGAFIDPYEEHIFWGGLTERLALRDLIEKIGMDGYKALEDRERVKQLDKMAAGYRKEFEKYGLECVKVET